MPKPNDQIGPYTLISKLGRGAFGAVWLAEKRTAIATTKVAIKIPNDEDVDLEAVRQEASLWVHASGHPNVLPIIDADIYDEQVIIVSEYAHDGSLTKWLEKHGGKAPSIEAAVEMMLGILSGLEHLHRRGIIHRDLKPDNILLQDETPRLADFGIARILKTTSKSTVATGTPAYMPPEAFDGKRSEHTDIWSAGVICYQLLTGRLPFPHTDISSLLMAIVTKESGPLPDSVPKPLQEVVRRALQKNPRERFNSAGEMRQALRAAIQQQPSTNNLGIKTEVLWPLLAELQPTILDRAEIQPDKSVNERRLSETQKLQLEYWIAFRDFLQKRDSFLKLPKPQPQHWFPISIGRTNFGLVATMHRKGRRVCAYMVFYGPDAKSHFHLLERDKGAIQDEVGEALEWRELPKRKESQVRLCKYRIEIENRQDWPSQHEWLQEKLELFHRVFAPRVQRLESSFKPVGIKEVQEEDIAKAAPAAAPPALSPTPIASPTITASTPALEEKPLEASSSSPNPSPARERNPWFAYLLALPFGFITFPFAFPPERADEYIKAPLFSSFVLSPLLYLLIGYGVAGAIFGFIFPRTDRSWGMWLTAIPTIYFGYLYLSNIPTQPISSIFSTIWGLVFFFVIYPLVVASLSSYLSSWSIEWIKQLKSKMK
ncbi:MAG TPA: DUF4268 domain-containing protein [Pyrinomonadaceae bacterium]|nr:DUF4268 domain-containing protein [Pyrinomonadaceae bacterium]